MRVETFLEHYSIKDDPISEFPWGLHFLAFVSKHYDQVTPIDSTHKDVLTALRNDPRDIAKKLLEYDLNILDEDTKHIATECSYIPSNEWEYITLPYLIALSVGTFIGISSAFVTIHTDLDLFYLLEQLVRLF